MAIIQISIISAHDKTERGNIGIRINSQYSSLQDPEYFEISKSNEAVEIAIKMGEKFARKNPNVSFIPWIRLKSGRKPLNFGKKTGSANPDLRKWLLPVKNDKTVSE